MDEYPPLIGHASDSFGLRVARASAQAARDHLTVQLIGVEAAEFVGEAVAEVAAGEREVVHRLTRLAEGGDAGHVAHELDGAARALEAHAVDAVRAVRRPA